MKHLHIKRPDLITILLLLFLAAIPATILFFNLIDNNIKHYAQQNRAVTELKLLDKDFNYFLDQKGTFHNYDEINRKVEKFSHILHNLRESMAHDNHIISYKYNEKLTDIEAAYQKKIDLIEHTKSYNSLIINSLNYLHDLQRNIERFSPIEDADLKMLDNTIFMTLQLYTDIQQDPLPIRRNIDKIAALDQKTSDRYLHFFRLHIENVMEKIAAIKAEQQKIAELNLYQKIDALHQTLYQEFNDYLRIAQVTITTILSILAGLLFVIFYLYRRSLATKKILSAYRYAIEKSDNSVVITDADQKIIYVNDAFEKESGYSRIEVIGENPKILNSGLMDESYYATLKQALQEGRKWEGEFINKTKDGRIYYEKASISPLFIDGNLYGYIAIKLNITQYIEQKNQVKYLAYHDQLTGLPNRYSFETYFRSEVEGNHREYALFYIDLDHFKTINDTLGHLSGDALLKIFAKRLQHELSEHDFIARIGGDEFVAISAISHLEDATAIAKRVLKSLYSPFQIGDHMLNITASIGVSLYPQDGKNLDALMKHADTAMYKAKNEGRNGYHFFTQQLSKEIYERLTIEQELRHALQREELYMVYQPKYSLKTRKIVGFEALIRWENEKLGFVPPDKFIPVAEEIGLIDKIGYFVFERACVEFQRFREIDPDLKHIAINVSTIQFKQADFIQHINALSFKTGLHPTQIELEVTESYVMEDIKHNIRSLQALRHNGYMIAIDDFGTGYSSFGYLKNLPITTLKIDKSFVDDICTQQKDRNIVHTIITLADHLGFNTVAEGIEDADQEALLKEMGCVTGQGYYFSRPLKPDDMVAFLQRQVEESAISAQMR